MESADVELVDDEILEGAGGLELRIAPVEGGGIVDYTVAIGCGDLAGAGILAAEVAVDEVEVFIARLRGGYGEFPDAAFVAFHFMAVAVPIIEVADHRDGVGIGSPHAKKGAGDAAAAVVLDDGAEIAGECAGLLLARFGEGRRAHGQEQKKQADKWVSRGDHRGECQPLALVGARSFLERI